MTWQDLTLAVGSLILAASLLPSIFSAYKPHAWTSALTVVIMLSFIAVDVSLHLMYAAVAIGISTVLWAILLAQVLWLNRGTWLQENFGVMAKGMWWRK